MNLKTVLDSVKNNFNSFVLYIDKLVGKFKSHVVVIIHKSEFLKFLHSGDRKEPVSGVPLSQRTVTIQSVPLPEIRDLTETQRAKLYRWRDEAQTPDCKRHREKAISIIEETIKNKRRDISFKSAYYMGTPPPILEDLVFLTKVDFSKCNLTEVPACLEKLPHLSELNLAWASNAVAHWRPKPKAMKSLKTLNLCGCSLESVPAWVRNLPAVTHLSLADNCVHKGALPPTLEVLNLDANQINQIPLALFRHGTKPLLVTLDFNPCDLVDIRRQTQSKRDVQVLTGRPGEAVGQQRVTLRCTERVLPINALSWNFDNALEHWYRLTGKPVPQHLKRELNFDFEQQETIRLLLTKLVASADYQNENMWYQQAECVTSLLESMARDKEVFSACMATLYEGTASCSDRASLILSHAEMTAKAIKTRLQGGKRALAEMGEAYYRLGVVNEMAKQRAKETGNHSEALEVDLLYQTYFSEKFSLPVGRGQGMLGALYAETDQVTLDRDEVTIRQKVENRTEDDRINHLCGWSYWTDHIKSELQNDDEYLKIQEKYVDLFAKLNFQYNPASNAIPDPVKFEQHSQLVADQKREIDTLIRKKTVAFFRTQQS